MTYSRFALERQSIFQSLWLEQKKILLIMVFLFYIIRAKISRHKILTFNLMIHNLNTLTQQVLQT